MTTFLMGEGYPQGLDRTKRRQFILQYIPYVLVDEILFKKDFNGVRLRCIKMDQIRKLFKEFHDGPTGGHISVRVIVIKIMRSSYYLPTLFNDFQKHVRKYIEQCIIC